jgi:hypothetical protein
MNLKEFFKPTWIKTALFLILGIAIYYFIPPYCNSPFPPPDFSCEGADYFQYRGLPFAISYSGGFIGLSETIIAFGLLLDLVIWYVLSSLIIWVYNIIFKRRKRK